MIASGMEKGMSESHDRLEELLAKTVFSPKSKETALKKRHFFRCKKPRFSHLKK